LIVSITKGYADYTYEVGEGGNAEGLVFLESHQDISRRTPVRRSGVTKIKLSKFSDTKYWLCPECPL
jgi:hypothetical protein